MMLFCQGTASPTKKLTAEVNRLKTKINSLFLVKLMFKIELTLISFAVSALNLSFLI